MSKEASEVVVAGTGSLWRAPVSTAFPADITVAVSESLWTELGYTKPDGVTFTFERNVNEIMGWQSRDPLRIVTTETPRSIKADLLQMNQNTWNSAMGGGTWTTPGAGKYQYVPPAPEFEDSFAYIIEAIDGVNKYRWCFRKVQNITGAEFTLQRNDAIALPLAVKVLAADGGLDPWLLQTNDANMGDPTQAGS